LKQSIESFGEEEGDSAFGGMAVQLHGDECGFGFADAVQVAVVEMFHFHIEDGKGREERARRPRPLAFAVYDNVRGTSESLREHVHHNITVVIRQCVQNYALGFVQHVTALKRFARRNYLILCILLL